MKKLIIIIVVIIAVLIATFLAVPIIFKDTLLEKTKTTINKEVNAKVDFEGFKLSLITSFPDLSLELEKVYIAGIGEFEKDTLLEISSFKTQIGLMSLFGSEGIDIKEIIMEDPILFLKVNEGGKANWDIAKETDNVAQSVQEQVNDNTVIEEDVFKLQLDKININNAEIIYDDRSISMTMAFRQADLEMNGNLYGTETELNTIGEVKEVLLTYDDINYISNIALKITSKLNIDYEKMNIGLVENELYLNQLPVDVSGDIKMPNDSMFFNLEFKSRTSGLNDFLALIPPDYEEYIKEIQANGSASLTGYFKGIYIGESYPSLNIRMKVSDGNLKYAQMPEEVKNIRADLMINKPQGSFDLTTVSVKDAHSEIRNNPIDLTLAVKNLMSDMFFDASLVGKVNFDHLKNALPLDSMEIAGVVDANLKVKGNYSSIENNQYEKITSDGIVALSNFSYSSPDLSQVVYIPKGKLDFSPKRINLSQFDMKIGSSDFNLAGGISNYLDYFLSDGVLVGDLRLNSKFVNLNELMLLQKEEKTENPKSEGKGEESEKSESRQPEVLAFNVPEDLDMDFTSAIDKALFDRLSITNINGLITIKDGKLSLDGLNMHMLDGEMKLTGSYQNTPQNQPLIDFGFDINSFNIPTAYRTLTGIQKMLPVAGYSEGEISTDFKMKGQLSSQMKLIASTIDGSGFFNTQKLQIIDSPTFEQLKGILKKEKLKNVKVDDFTAKFSFDDGNMSLKPFKTKVADQEVTVYGNLSAESLLDMKMDFVVEREAFGDDIQSILGILPGQERIKDVPATVVIKGPVGKPEVKMDLSQARDKIMAEVKKSSSEDLQKSLNKLGEGLKKLFK